MMTVQDAIDANVSILIFPDGTTAPLSPPEGQHKLSLEQLQSAVGGYIELIPINVKPRSWKLFVNEDGRRMQLRPNPTASALCAMPHTVLVGTAVLTRHV